MEDDVDGEGREPRAPPQEQRCAEDVQRDGAPRARQDHRVVVEEEAERHLVRSRPQPQSERFAGEPVGRQLHQAGEDQNDLYLSPQHEDSCARHRLRPTRGPQTGVQGVGPMGRQGAQEDREEEDEIEVVEVIGLIQQEETGEENCECDDRDAVEEAKHREKRGDRFGAPG